MRTHSLQPLGQTRKRFGLALIAIGLLTFPAPLVLLNPPVQNESRWSSWTLIVSLYERRLPVPGGHWEFALFEIPLAYVLLIVALAALYRPGPPKMLAVTTGVGFMLSSTGRFWYSDLMGVFGYREHVRRGPALWVLPFIMPFLLYVCFATWLDNADP